MSEVTQDKGSDATQGGGDATESRASGPVMRPAGDIFEDGDGIVLLLDMPGVAAERLHIESDRNSLVVEGEIAIDVPTDTESLYADIRTTRYRRSFSLSGEQLDTAAVDAVLKDGVLRIAIPKRAETRPRRIEVRTG